MNQHQFIKLITYCILAISILSLAGCNDKGKTGITAIYLTPESGGQLTKEELSNYPEVISVTTFNELKNSVSEKTAIWLDKDSLNLIDLKWLQKEAASNLPIVLIGYNNALYSFRDKLDVFGIQGPRVDWSQKKLEPGFSVGMLKEPNSSSAFMKGYNSTPDVKQILSITNMLLEGKVPKDLLQN